MPPLPNALQHWYDALRSQSGVCIVTSDRTRAIAALYKARKEALDPVLETISLTQSPTSPDEIWLVHNGKEVKREP